MLMLGLILSIGSVTLKMVRAFQGEVGERDPMFAEEPERVTQAPVGEEDSRTFEDNSANWDVSVQTPVDLTAAELGEEARAKSANP